MEVKINLSNLSQAVLSASFCSRGFFIRLEREGFAVVGHSILARFHRGSLLHIMFPPPYPSHSPSPSTSTSPSTLASTLSCLSWPCSGSPGALVLQLLPKIWKHFWQVVKLVGKEHLSCWRDWWEICYFHLQEFIKGWHDVSPFARSTSWWEDYQDFEWNLQYYLQ